jgi:hypothetical protein
MVIPRNLEQVPSHPALDETPSRTKQIGCLFGSINPEYQKNLRAIIYPHLIEEQRHEHRDATSQGSFWG